MFFVGYKQHSGEIAGGCDPFASLPNPYGPFVLVVEVKMRLAQARWRLRSQSACSDESPFRGHRRLRSRSCEFDPQKWEDLEGFDCYKNDYSKDAERADALPKIAASIGL